MYLKGHTIDIYLRSYSKYVRKLHAFKDVHLIHGRNVVAHRTRSATPHSEQLTGIAPNSRRQSKTVNIKFHLMNEQRCINEFEVQCLTKQHMERESKSYGYY